MRESLNTEANLYDDFLNKMKKDRVTTHSYPVYYVVGSPM